MSGLFNEFGPNPNEYQSVDEIIAAALTTMDAVSLTPQEAQAILNFRLHQRAELLRDGVLEPKDASDEVFALGEIANGNQERSFGEVYRKYHVSSAGIPFMAGVDETTLAQELSTGAIWQKLAHFQRFNNPDPSAPA